MGSGLLEGSPGTVLGCSTVSAVGTAVTLSPAVGTASVQLPGASRNPVWPYPPHPNPGLTYRCTEAAGIPLSLHQHLALSEEKALSSPKHRDGTATSHLTHGELSATPSTSPVGSPWRCGHSMVSSAPQGRAGTGRHGRAPSASGPPAHGSGPGAHTPGMALSGTCERRHQQGLSTWCVAHRTRHMAHSTQNAMGNITCGPCGRCRGTAGWCRACWGGWGCGRTTGCSAHRKAPGIHPRVTRQTNCSSLWAQTR